ncbi:MULTISPECIES: translation initiation factor [Planktothricoides]|uniref:Translation initiation factor n=2 Tax=Planktothricoides raciborskii TaxID=132608 RepID=A0AAU8JL58_9CYAN|nr:MULTISPECIES: translation initiation factor [Planktothricoides]KOR35954.1 translation initiation factor Sui1 [Planktothricoides sp. SR001]MBD2547420.1 translation initiation factor [Planktothricoides raciborskii FACHB-1370]MBD2583742.1 translation initiation factor [Planktothricoides raciborskii FACHB-1261]
MATSQGKSKKNPIVYQEFGTPTDQFKTLLGASSADALERGITELPPSQQNLRVEASRKQRKGKTVTVITGFQAKPETLATLVKQLKALCGAGGTVKENTIEIQGDHRQKLLEHLIKLGYKAKISGGN